MAGLIGKIRQAATLLVHDRREFWKRLKPYFIKPDVPKSGTRRINGIPFEIDLDLDPAMAQMYLGNYQQDLVDFLRKHLRRGDAFVDVGANVGYVSAIALGLVGEAGAVHAFEPVPRYFQRLQRLQQNNPRHQLQVNAAALGETPGTAQIAVTNLRNIGWNTMVPDLMTAETTKEKIDVPVLTLDDYLANHNVRNLRVVKIDTEGYEFPVLKGFQNYLRTAAQPPLLVIEIAPSAYPPLQTSLSELAKFMTDLGYVPRDMDLRTPVRIEELNETTDVVFVPQR